MSSMSKYKEINLEEGMPTVDEAMSYLKMSITLCKQNKIGCLAVIVGGGRLTIQLIDGSNRTKRLIVLCGCGIISSIKSK